jgi:methionyl-tRNA formyltransferase
MLDLPKFGNINLHASLLPKYRGAAPIQWAIANGETVTGVTTMRINAGLDTGDILLQRALSVGADDTAETIAPTLAELGSDLVVETLHGLESGTVQRHPQDDSQASLARILKKEDGLVDFHRSASEIFNRIRGFQPWPGAYSRFREKTLQILKAKPAQIRLPPAELSIREGRLFVGSGNDTSLELSEVQVEGKKRSTAGAFIQGYQPKAGEKLG